MAARASLLKNGRHLLAARRPVVLAYNGGVGDRLCHLPALRALSTLFAGRLALIASPGDRDIYYSDLPTRESHEITFDLAPEGFHFDAPRLAEQIRGCDLLLSLNGWHTTSVSQLLGLLPDVETVGFSAEFDNHLAHDSDTHAMDRVFSLPRHLDPSVRIEDFAAPPAIADRHEDLANSFWQHGVRWTRTLFVHMDTKPEKAWPEPRLKQLLEGFLAQSPAYGAVIVDVRGSWVPGSMASRTLPISLPLESCFAVLRRCDLFLGVDSCHLHAADLFGVPGVGLFGPTSSARWGFRLAPHRHVQGKGSMADVHVENALGALEELARISRFRPSRARPD